MKKYRLIIDSLESKIAANLLRAGDKLPTEQEMMETYGVSRITVRAALNELAARGVITRIAGRGTFYTGESTTTQKKKTVIALIILHSVNELIRIAEGVNSVTESSDVTLALHITNGNTEREREICQKVIDDGADGIIIFPNNERSNKDFFFDLQLQNYPVVFIDRSPLVNCNIIQANGESGVYLLTEYLVGIGHKNIAYITSFDYEPLKDRFRGFIAAMKKHDLAVRREYIIPLKRSLASVSDSSAPVEAGVKKLLALENPPTAIMCSNDIIALHTTNVLKRLGAEHISVTGFDNANYSSKNAYSITTAEQDFYQIGRVAADMLLNLIHDPSQGLIRIKLPVKLIKRGSTAPIGN